MLQQHHYNTNLFYKPSVDILDVIFFNVTTTEYLLHNNNNSNSNSNNNTTTSEHHQFSQHDLSLKLQLWTIEASFALKMLTFTQTNVNAKPFFLLGADVPKSCPKIRRYDSAFSSNIFRCWNRCVGFFTYLDLIKIGALGGGSQNFLVAIQIICDTFPPHSVTLARTPFPPMWHDNFHFTENIAFSRFFKDNFN